MKKELKNHGIKRLVYILTLVFVVLFSSCAPINLGTLELSEKAVSLEVGESITLIATSSLGAKIAWSSANEQIATVEDGVIVGTGVGEVIVTAYTNFALATCAVTVKEGPKPDASIEGLTLAWRDEFDGTELDLTKWGYQHGIHDVYHGKNSKTLYWGNNELQYYTEDAVSVKDGSLVITAQREDIEDMEYTSARILTRDLAYFTYGYFEARIKLPTIQGMWPAFWMMPQPSQTTSTGNEYGGWPISGEIDIMEARGRKPNEVGNALHFGGSGAHQCLSTSYATESSISEWHTYGVNWTPQSITWYVDGKVSFKLTNDRYYSTASNGDSAPFDKPFYILLNLAVGGNYDGGRKPPEDFVSADMCVDYVRVYKHL